MLPRKDNPDERGDWIQEVAFTLSVVVTITRFHTGKADAFFADFGGRIRQQGIHSYLLYSPTELQEIFRSRRIESLALQAGRDAL